MQGDEKSRMHFWSLKRISWFLKPSRCTSFDDDTERVGQWLLRCLHLLSLSYLYIWNASHHESNWNYTLILKVWMLVGCEESLASYQFGCLMLQSLVLHNEVMINRAVGRDPQVFYLVELDVQVPLIRVISMMFSSMIIYPGSQIRCCNRMKLIYIASCSIPRTWLLNS